MKEKILLFILLIFISQITFVFSETNYNDFKYIEKDNYIEIIDYVNKEKKDIIIPKHINGKQVISIGNSAFESKDLRSVIIPNSVNRIGVAAFSNNNITSIAIPDSVTNIGYFAFTGNRLESLVIPDSVDNIETAAFSINNLEKIIIPDSVTNIGDKAFSHNNLKDITIPDSVIRIESEAFSNNNLKNIIIPDSVKYIGDKAFSYNNIISITIPKSVEHIGEKIILNSDKMFYDGPGIAHVIKNSFAEKYCINNNINYKLEYEENSLKDNYRYILLAIMLFIVISIFIYNKKK